GPPPLGPYRGRFEEPSAAAPAARHAVAVSSGTAALNIALQVAGVAGRDVVVPANTFYATAAAVLQAGARPVFADVELGTLALSRATVEAALTPQTAAVVHVHIGGMISPDITPGRALCDDPRISPRCARCATTAGSR